MSLRKRLPAVVATTVLLALAASACGSDTKTATTTGPTTTAATGSTTTGGSVTTEVITEVTTSTAPAPDPLGAPNKATGSPVKIGIITDGQSAAIDSTSELLMLGASVKYANEYLGGLGGHVIDPVICETKQDAAVAKDCGTKMVQEGVAAVMYNVSGQGSAFAPPIIEAKIPLIVFTAVDGIVITNKDTVFNVGSALGSFALPAILAKEKGYKKAAWLVIDVPSASGPAKALGPILMKNAGATVDVVTIPPGTANVSSQIQAALANNPEIVHMIGDGPFCTAAIKGLRDAQYKGVISGISNCIDANTVSTLGKDLKDVVISYSAVEDPANADYQAYLAVRTKYGSDKIDKTGTAVGAFALVVAFTRMTAKMTGEITSAAIVTTIKANSALPLPLGAGLKFKCDGTAISFAPAVCTGGVVISTLGENGEPTTYTKLDADPALFKLG